MTHDAGHTEDLINDTFLKLSGKISLLRTLEIVVVLDYPYAETGFTDERYKSNFYNNFLQHRFFALQCGA